MQTHWTLNGSRKLILFFSGWGMDEKPTRHLTSDGYDLCTCFNYHTLETADSEKWARYDEIILIAWSMGVWAAEQVVARMGICSGGSIPRQGLPITCAIAINGTPTAVDELTGIPPVVAEATCNGLNQVTLAKFMRRIYGGASLMKEMENADALPCIDIDGRREELHRIISAPQDVTSIHWNKAIIGSGDAIFPSTNMSRYWEGRCEVCLLEAPHYPFHLYTNWNEIIAQPVGEPENRAPKTNTGSKAF